MGAKLLEWRPRFGRIARRNDSGSRPGSLLAEISLIHQFHSDPFPNQKISGRQPNDPAADNQYVGMICHWVVI
jgi:hypothetical protein